MGKILSISLNPQPPSDTVRKPKKKKEKKTLLKDLFSSVQSQSKKYHPSGNLKFNNLGIFPNLEVACFNRKNPFNFS